MTHKRNTSLTLAFVTVVAIAGSAIIASVEVALAQGEPSPPRSDVKSAPKQTAPSPGTMPKTSSSTGKARSSADAPSPPKSITK
jgi:hypothetical protein